MSTQNKLAIVVAGGPAPGINGVISAVTIEVCKRGIPVLGIPDGFRWLLAGEIQRAIPLTIGDVSRIHLTGGSILRTSRTNATSRPEDLTAVVQSLATLGVRWLVTIGGNGTAYAASRIAEHAGPCLAVVHVPKTIDNDLPLPGDVPTFGFETARHEGVSIVRRIMEDARATSRWYLLVAMGRQTGHLALGIGKAAGATLALIPEEFPEERIRLARLADSVEGSIIKRLAAGQENGVVVLAEGLSDKIEPADLAGLEQAERDDQGHVRLSDLPLGEVLKETLRARLSRRSISLKFVAKDIGYELRCADPIPFDSEYTRDLGYGAARTILEGGGDCMITRQNGKIVVMPFREMMDPKTGRTRVRMVDVGSESYAVARQYMIRLGAADLADPLWAQALADAGHTTVADLQERFGAA